MPISVLCEECKHEFSAWDDLAGRTVECPKCQASVVVGGEVDEDEWEDEDDEDEDDDEFRLAPVDHSLLTPSAGTELPTGSDAETTVPATGEQPQEEIPADCPKCGASLDDGMLCDHCGYNVQLKRVIQSEVETFNPIKDVGFKRWFNDQLAEGESLSTVVFWASIVGGFLLAAYTLLYFPGSLCLTIPILVVVAAIYVFVKRSGKGDDAFYDLGTGASLMLFRAVGWRKLEWPFPKVPFYSAKGTDFGDDDLGTMTNAGDIEALDLENCPITDQGLVHLAEWNQLRFLVLKNTQVTREAVVELQKQLTKTMIWM